MNIFLFSQNAWDETNAFGNTVSNFFEGWDQDTFSHFYIRQQVPVNTVADNYYCLPVGTVIKKLIHKNKKKCSFTRREIPQISKDTVTAMEQEREKIQKIHKKSSTLTHIIYEEMWMSCIWMDKEFKQFIADNKPDVFFAFAANAFLLYPLVQYMKKHTHAKIVLFIADDVYGNYESTAFIRGARLRKYFRKSMEQADIVYAISEEMQQRYQVLFQREIGLLRKGCQFSAPISEQINTPLRLVYAGNLLYGRTEILQNIADVLSKLNNGNNLAELEIYSPTVLEEQERVALEAGGVCRFMGPRSYAEIKKIQNKADLVLHVESFDEEQIAATKYSFSTKIIDCIQSGSAVLAIGPRESASIACMKKINGINVLDDIACLDKFLQDLLARAHEFPAQAAAIRAATVQEYDIDAVRKRLRGTFVELVGQDRV